jgi:hypothetical protein
LDIERGKFMLKTFVDRRRPCRIFRAACGDDACQQIEGMLYALFE